MRQPTQSEASAPEGIERFIVFGVVALALLLAALNQTTAVVALPQIAKGIGASFIWVGWVITSYQLAQCVTMPLVGRLSDKFGRKRIFMIAVAIFTLSSFGAGASNNIVMLIACRTLMAVGGGAFMPSAAGIVSDQFPRQRQQAIGLFSSIFPIGGILGPNLGGFLVEHFSWRWAFYINVPIAATVFVLAWFLLKESKRPVEHRFDFSGAAFLGLGIVSFMLALALLGGKYDIPLGAIIALLASSVALLLLFWRHELHHPEPIVDLELLNLRPFVAANLFNTFFGAIAFGFFSFIPMFTVAVYGFTTLQSGNVLTGRALAMIVVSSLTSFFLLKRVSYRRLIIGGLVLIAMSLLTLSAGFNQVNVLGLAIPDFWLVSFVLTFSGAGVGLLNPPSNNAGMELLPSKVAAITGLRGMLRSAGGVISTTVIFFLLTGYQHQAQGLQEVFLILGLLMPLVIPLVLMMPTGREKPLAQDTGHGRELRPAAPPSSSATAIHPPR